MQICSGFFLYTDHFIFLISCTTPALKLFPSFVSTTDKDLSPLIPESFEGVVLLKTENVCWVTSKLTTSKMAPTVLDVFEGSYKVLK